jgi:hypothetical protein
MAGFKIGVSKVGSTDPIGFADAPAGGSGHVIQQHTQIRLLQAEKMPRQVDHHTAMFFRRAAAILAQPFFMFYATAAPAAKRKYEARITRRCSSTGQRLLHRSNRSRFSCLPRPSVQLIRWRK